MKIKKILIFEIDYFELQKVCSIVVLIVYQLTSQLVSTMGFKGLILIESLALAVFTGMVLFFTKFVNFFEIELHLAMIVADCFFVTAGFAIVFVLMLNFKKFPDAEKAKKMVREIY